MMLSKHSPSRTHISYPMNSELAPCFSSPELPVSPPTTPPRCNQHSFPKPMAWLNRASSSTTRSTNAPYAAPKPTRISEPKFPGSLEQLRSHRSGQLGSGATVVRTPQEALLGSAHNLTNEEDGVKQEILSHNTEKNESRLLPPRLSSPPLPPLPDIPDTGGRLSGSPASVALSDHVPVPPSASSGSLSSLGHFSSSKPTLLAHSRASSRSMPTLPVNTNLTPPQPSFEAILLSPIPDGAIDPSKLIVTLETCTTTCRTTLRSLVSRPSHLSRYFTSLLSPVSETASVYSNASDTPSAQHNSGFSTLFRDHLASSGCLPPSTGIHIFLDRVSAPYIHILAYLRSVPGTPEHPETLPRAVQLGPMWPSRLESLLELRDEANYLGLVELEKLCSQEIQRSPHVPIATCANGTLRGQTGSVHSVHTIVEQCQSRQEVRPSEVSKGGKGGCRSVKSATRESGLGSLFENKDRDGYIQEHGRQGRAIKYEVEFPPPGWI